MVYTSLSDGVQLHDPGSSRITSPTPRLHGSELGEQTGFTFAIRISRIVIGFIVI
jgi:hypothetical protein